MPQLFPELRVEIRKLGNDFLAVTKQDTGREICNNRFQHNATQQLHRNLLWLLDRSAMDPEETLPGSLMASDMIDENQLIRYGQRLYGYLFGDGKVLKNFLNTNPNYSDQAHIVLALYPKAVTLWSLPWEYLHDGEKFVNLEGRLHLSRVLGELDTLATSKTPGPLRILIIISNPEDQEVVDAERELTLIQESLNDLRATGQVIVDYADEANIEVLKATLKRQRYHILYYIGHATYQRKRQRGFLCFETLNGQTDLIDAQQLAPLLNDKGMPQMLILNPSQNSGRNAKDAFDNIATELLQANIPTILAMQAGLVDESAIELIRVLFTKLAQGATVSQAVQQVRKALHDLDDERTPYEQRFDWGIPMLYQRTKSMQLIDPGTPIIAQNISGRHIWNTTALPLPATLGGRQAELYAAREAIKQHIPALALQGITGMGKSALAARLLHYPGTKIDDTLVIHCTELYYPEQALGLLSDFWLYHGHTQAAKLLLNTQLPAEERAQQAAKMVDTPSYLVLFDGLDAWFSLVHEPAGPCKIANKLMGNILKGLLAVNTNTTYIFTSRKSWDTLESLPHDRKTSVSLSELKLRYAVQCMNTQPYLGKESLTNKLAIYRQISGNPQVLELLNGWLSTQRDLQKLFSAKETPIPRAHEEWIQYFLNSIYNQFSEEEKTYLKALSIINGPFREDMIYKALGIPLNSAKKLLRSCASLGLIQQHHIDERNRANYIFPAAVRQYLREHLKPEQERSTHVHAAVYYGAPFLEEARKRAIRQSSTTWNDEQVEWLARSREGVLGMWVYQTQDLQLSRWAINRALAWQHHLFEIGQVKQAHEITTAIYPALTRWQQRDLAKAILVQNINTLKGSERAITMQKLGELLADEGHIKESLNLYTKAYNTFAALEDTKHTAETLLAMGQLYQQVSNYDQAINTTETALKIQTQQGYESRRLATLQQLSKLYYQKGDAEQAIAYGQTAETLARELKNETALIVILYNQGHNFLQANKQAEAYDKFSKSLELAQQIGDSQYTAENYTALGQLLLKGGQLAQAEAAFNEALQIHQRHTSPKVGEVLELLGQVYEQQEHYKEALDKYQQAQRVYQAAN
ncbi:MAG: tetratricopeptide repeat protein, partial [Anaerolineae bacterium]|nr:tetratricopeptide repeat protein [Anaerolineae bacterium]